MPYTILVVDDEIDIITNLEYNLAKENYLIITAQDGASAIAHATGEQTPDLMLLDLMLPDMSGKDVCKHLRSHPQTKNLPIIMLTAKGEESNRIAGFEVGADDYIVKPFSVKELLLRIQAVLRRVQPSDSSDIQASKPHHFSFGELRLETDTHTAYVEKIELKLTAIEFKLLFQLLDQKGLVQTREKLLESVWDIHADITTRTVDTHVKRLRQKLGVASSYIETLRGVGYRFKSKLEPSA
jgi:two-component system phosphate regulon response regulator PhoB